MRKLLVASLGLGTANIPFTGNRLALAHRRLNVLHQQFFPRQRLKIKDISYLAQHFLIDNR